MTVREHQMTVPVGTLLTAVRCRLRLRLKLGRLGILLILLWLLLLLLLVVILLLLQLLIVNALQLLHNSRCLWQLGEAFRRLQRVQL